MQISESQPWWPSTPLGQGPLGGLRTLREAPPQHLFDVFLSGYVDLASVRICTMKWTTLETTFKHEHSSSTNKHSVLVSVLACFGVGLGPLGGQARAADACFGGLPGGLCSGGLVGTAFRHIRRGQKTMENNTSTFDIGVLA